MSEEKTPLQPAVQQKTASERFTNAVTTEFSSNVGNLELTPFQKKLIQNYFIKLDRTLKDAEIKRAGKQGADSVSITWENVNMIRLSQDVVALSSVGLDPLQNNHVNLIPYKNNSTGKYDITPIVGYKGLELVSKQFALEIPSDVIIELVYSKDTFKPVKKSLSEKVENYTFEINNPWDRGDVVGAFYYLVFDDQTKNKLRFYNVAQLEKRKPKYASVEFWGGERKKYNSQELEKVEGWRDEMLFKTICRLCYNSFTISSEKINNQFLDTQEIIAREFNSDIATETKIEVNGGTVSEDVNFELVGNENLIDLQEETTPNPYGAKTVPLSASEKMKAEKLKTKAEPISEIKIDAIGQAKADF